MIWCGHSSLGWTKDWRRDPNRMKRKKRGPYEMERKRQLQCGPFIWKIRKRKGIVHKISSLKRWSLPSTSTSFNIGHSQSVSRHIVPRFWIPIVLFLLPLSYLALLGIHESGSGEKTRSQKDWWSAREVHIRVVQRLHHREAMRETGQDGPTVWHTQGKNTQTETGERER